MQGVEFNDAKSFGSRAEMANKLIKIRYDIIINDGLPSIKGMLGL